MGHLVAAPDKFRGTADAAQAAAAAARGARRAGWTASEVPLADGGEGLLSAFGGEVRYDEVTGPLGTPVLAEWRLVPGTSTRDGPIAVIEMARASGLVIAGGLPHNDPIGASTVGVRLWRIVRPEAVMLDISVRGPRAGSRTRTPA